MRRKPEGNLHHKMDLTYIYINKYMPIVESATKGFSRKQLYRVSLMLEGMVKLEGVEGEAAKTIREKFFIPLFKEAVDAGILEPGQYTKDYYPRLQELVKHISGESVKLGDPWFAHERTGKLEDYNRDVREVAYIYVNAMAKRLFIKPVIEA